MSDESKEAISTTDTSQGEKEESKDTKDSMEQDEADTSQEKDESMEKSEEEDDKKEKDKNNEEENDEDDEEESDDEPQVGLLEKPLVLEEGKKRERKKVERMTFQSGEKAYEGIKEGKGRSLGDIPYIEHMLGRTKAEDVKPLHRLLYRRPGSNHDVKKNIRQFSGFPFSKDDVEYDKRTQMLKGKNFTLPMIKRIMDILDIPRNGVKDELVARLMEWLEKPKDSGRKLPQSKRKRKSKGSAGKKKEGKKDKKKEKKKKKETKSKVSAGDGDDDDDEDMEDLDDTKASDDEGDADKDDSDQESEQSEEEEAPPKKKAKKATPKPKEKKAKQKTTPKAKPSKTPTKKKATPKKKAKVSNDEVSDVSSDSDEEPLIHKEKSKSAPTNDELKDVVKKMLDNANLEQVTMKTVLKDVFAKYPDFDLTDRKDFIKNTVKQIIS